MRGAKAVVVAGLLAFTAAQPAPGGAWPQAQGTGFLASSVTLWRPPGGRVQGRSEAYLDWGLRHGWTLTLDITLPSAGGTEAIATLSRPVPWPTGRAVMSWGLGLGHRRIPGAAPVTFARPRMAWGRGFGAGFLPWPGWLSAEASVDFAPGGGRPSAKLDLTLGLKPSERWTAILQARASTYPGAPAQLRLVPALVRRIGRHRIEIAPGITLAGGHGADLQIALWTDF